MFPILMQLWFSAEFNFKINTKDTTNKDVLKEQSPDERRAWKDISSGNKEINNADMIISDTGLRVKKRIVKQKQTKLEVKSNKRERI